MGVRNLGGATDDAEVAENPGPPDEGYRARGGQSERVQPALGRAPLHKPEVNHHEKEGGYERVFFGQKTKQQEAEPNRPRPSPSLFLPPGGSHHEERREREERREEILAIVDGRHR